LNGCASSFEALTLKQLEMTHVKTTKALRVLKTFTHEETPTPTPDKPATAPRLVPIAVVDMGRWTARVGADGRVEMAGRPGEDVSPAQAAEALRRVVTEQHKALCPGGVGSWVGTKAAIMVGVRVVAVGLDANGTDGTGT
jgi:hypothetical protein